MILWLDYAADLCQRHETVSTK